MKVTGENSFVNLDAYLRNVKEQRRAGAGTAGECPQKPGEDTVELSPEVRQIREAKAVLDTVPDVNEEKVAGIKARIENGTYTIDEAKIAAKIVRDALLGDEEL